QRTDRPGPRERQAVAAGQPAEGRRDPAEGAGEARLVGAGRRQRGGRERTAGSAAGPETGTSHRRGGIRGLTTEARRTRRKDKSSLLSFLRVLRASVVNSLKQWT